MKILDGMMTHQLTLEHRVALSNSFIVTLSNFHNEIWSSKSICLHDRYKAHVNKKAPAEQVCKFAVGCGDYVLITLESLSKST